MQIELEVGYDDNGESIMVSVPAKFEVCPECEGHGFVLNPSMRGHCYTQEEFDEEFSDEDDRAEYFKRGGRYDVVCPNCKGKNVILVANEDACTPEQLEALEAHDEWQNELWTQREFDRKTMMMESGCWGG